MKYTRNCRSQPRLHALAAALGTPKVLLAGLAGIPLLWSQAAWSQSIQTDGRTLTTVTTAGAVTDVRTGTISGNAGFNSFKSFNVNAGHTANLHVPAGAVNLVNIVRDTRTDIQGTLNAIPRRPDRRECVFRQSARIRGGCGRRRERGFAVGEHADAGLRGSLLQCGGSAGCGRRGAIARRHRPLGAGGLIRIDGRINAVDGVALAAGTVRRGWRGVHGCALRGRGAGLRRCGQRAGSGGGQPGGGASGPRICADGRKRTSRSRARWMRAAGHRRTAGRSA